MKRLLTLLVAVLIIVGLGYVLTKMGGSQSLIPPKNDAAKEEYAAVFLDNDQVYFGKISLSGKVVVMKDIYYIRLDQAQPQQSGEEQTQPKLSLVKLGDQIHGPVDEMHINQDHVLFVERLKDDSTVVRAIKQEKDNQNNGDTQTPAEQTPAQPTDQATPSTDQTQPSTTESKP